MSGTSLDGIDFCWVKFSNTNNWQFEIVEAQTIPYSIKWKEKLNQAHRLTSNNLARLNEEYSLFLSEAIAHFIAKKNIINLDFVASHGHTILHQPKNGITLQIGNLQQITNKLNLPVICDFRVQDVQLGGQGAPLVPIGDRLLFGEYDSCVNLGGFANISFEENKQRIAYDICPVNIVLNYFAEKLGVNFDEDGAIAKANKHDDALLEDLNRRTYYAEKSPKSLGKEWVEDEFLPIIETYKLSPEVIIATLTHHAAYQIAKNLKPNQKVLVTGGGAFNSHLIRLLQSQTLAKIILPDNKIINYKEALIFAFLGVLRKLNQPNVLASVTGASKNHSSGIIHLPV
ncbi:anhydro-N-acetylmuramic acid kinase [Psychroflexus salis]|uniref:Anhydro-N-acetylmuramic acid kinase n=2 Tax=Psychroflexus salis TaxID=1526574 RepID=A0A916ZMF1_9FLAO|nr:anhydro-N-acetylmuramic acid kinase [Psychroflexus salis]